MIDCTIDFTNCERAYGMYGGSDRKFGVIYNGTVFMLKFSDQHAKRRDISTSHVNNAISEYISSHISESIGLPTHDTVLGTYNGEIVVGCRDFRQGDYSIVEFADFVRAIYHSSEFKRIIKLRQIYETLEDPQNNLPKKLRDESIKRFWDTFVVDALVGNFDRHVGNWGYLVKDNHLQLAPVYDFGSSLFPHASDEGAKSFLQSPVEMVKRCLQFPSPPLAISDEKIGKAGYYEMLSSNYDEECTRAVLRIVPNINMEAIRSIVDGTPFITDIRKEFYKQILQLRYETILYRSYVRCLSGEFDSVAKKRLERGISLSDNDLARFLETRRSNLEPFAQNERKLIAFLENGERGSGRVSADAFVRLANRQRLFVEESGIQSEIPAGVLSRPELFLETCGYDPKISGGMIGKRRPVESNDQTEDEQDEGVNFEEDGSLHLIQ